MLIEKDVHRLIRILNFGSFPENVLSLGNSDLYLERLVYADYQAQKRYHGTRELFSVDDNGFDTDASFLDPLISDIELLNSRLSGGSQSPQEALYAVNVLAYLHLLKNDKQTGLEVLRSFRFRESLKFETQTDKQFYDYLYARYCTLTGICSNNNEYWLNYLKQLKAYGQTSEVALNSWIQCLCKSLIQKLSLNGTRPMTFKDFESMGLPNPAFVVLLNCLLKVENEKYISKSLFKEYSKFLPKFLETEANSKSQSFPNSDNADNSEETLAHTVFETLNDISSHRPVVHFFLKPKTSKLFLVSKLQTTYQSRIILAHMIKTQTDLELYDEAIAAFKTYNSYVLKEKEQNGNRVGDMLQILDIFSHCFQVFNPAKSFRTTALFKYNDVHDVVKTLLDMVPTFLGHLKDACLMSDLSYEQESVDGLSINDRDISFLYHDSNPQLISSSHNKLSLTMASAWYSISMLYQYLARFSSPETQGMFKNMTLGQEYLKKSLLLDCAGNTSQLYNYALILAHQNKLKPAVKLCKFTLKKYPNSFKTWNLLVLVTSAIEKKDSFEDTTAFDIAGSNVLDDHSIDHSDGGITVNMSKFSISKGYGAARLERFIADALNLASLFVLNQKKLGKSLTDEVKYDVIQLKLTQLELMRQNHGPDSAFELVNELFDLYREIYLVSTSSELSDKERQQEKRWSHRPTVLDPSELAGINGGESPKARSSHEKIKEHPESRKLISDRNSIKTSGGARDSAAGGTKLVPKASAKSRDTFVLQEIWLWTAGMYQELNLYDEAEQCIVEAETVHEPNVNSFTAFGIFACRSRKFLALQEFEKALEMYHLPAEKFNKVGYGVTLVAMCRLFMIDDDQHKSLFISQKDLEAGLIRLKNYLEDYSHCWPCGFTDSGVWYFLSLIYEKFDDKVLYEKALWRCIELESAKPVRPYNAWELLCS